VPGYGHAVLRTTDPRFMCMIEFSNKHIKSTDPLIKLCKDFYSVVPEILADHKNVLNPWPNIDAVSGVVLSHYGVKEPEFFTVLFAISRSIGIMSALVWSRALGLPIERPKSVTLENILNQVEGLKY